MEWINVVLIVFIFAGGWFFWNRKESPNDTVLNTVLFISVSVLFLFIINMIAGVSTNDKSYHSSQEPPPIMQIDTSLNGLHFHWKLDDFKYFGFKHEDQR